MKASETLDIAIGLNLGSSADAEVIAGVLNNQLISFAKMMIAGQLPEPLPMLESLGASASGDRAILSLVISVADLEILQEMAAGMGFSPQGM